MEFFHLIPCEDNCQNPPSLSCDWPGWPDLWRRRRKKVGFEISGQHGNALLGAGGNRGSGLAPLLRGEATITFGP